MNSISFLALQILIQGENTQKSKKDPGRPKKVPDIMPIKKVQKDAFNVHISEKI